jgi:hypothetical protein
MSFADKLANGIAYQIIEIINPSCSDPSRTTCSRFYRNIMVFVPGTCVLLVFLILVTFNTTTLGIRRKRRIERMEDEQVLISE